MNTNRLDDHILNFSDEEYKLEDDSNDFYRRLDEEREGPSAVVWARIMEDYHETEQQQHECEQNRRRENREKELACMGLLKYKSMPYKRCSYSSLSVDQFRLNDLMKSRTSEYKGCPWRPSDHNYGNTIQSLHDEIMQFTAYMQPTIEEKLARKHTVSRVEDAITELWNSTKVVTYGSFGTGLYLPTSDIDIAVLNLCAENPLKTLEAALFRSGIVQHGLLFVVKTANVPIIKMVESSTLLSVDISFNRTSAGYSVGVVNYFKAKFPLLEKIVMMLKQYLMQQDLNEVFTGGISSYAILLLVASFMQMKYIDQNTDNLAIWLLGILDFYGRRFDYKSICISVNNGGQYLLREQKTNDTRPSSFLSIQDPLDPKNDVTRGSYRAQRVQQAFDHAHRLLSLALRNASIADCKKKSLLSLIICVPDDLIEFREMLKYNYNRIKRKKTTASLSATDNSSQCNEEMQPRLQELNQKYIKQMQQQYLKNRQAQVEFSPARQPYNFPQRNQQSAAYEGSARSNSIQSESEYENSSHCTQLSPLLGFNLPQQYQQCGVNNVTAASDFTNNGSPYIPSNGIPVPAVWTHFPVINNGTIFYPNNAAVNENNSDNRPPMGPLLGACPLQHLQPYPLLYPPQHPTQHPPPHPQSYLQSYPPPHPQLYPQLYPPPHPQLYPQSYPPPHPQLHPQSYPPPYQQYPANVIWVPFNIINQGSVNNPNIESIDENSCENIPYRTAYRPILGTSPPIQKQQCSANNIRASSNVINQGSANNLNSGNIDENICDNSPSRTQEHPLLGADASKK